MKASDYKASAARHIIVYGAPKTGKTELVGTLAEKYHLWWLNLDDGIKTLFRPDSAAHKYLDNIELFNIPDKQTWPIAIETVLKILRGGAVSICHKHGKVSCPVCKTAPSSSINLDEFDVKKDILVIDHYTQLMDSVMNRIHKDALQAENWDDLKSTFHEWMKQGAMSDRIGSTLQCAPYNAVIISHEITAEMEDGTKKITPVGGTRNKSADFARYFDDVVYTEIVGGQYKAYVSAGDKSRIVIGSRTGKKFSPKAKLWELFE